MIKPILRTIPTLSGNVKLACTLLDYNKLNNDTFETNIRGAHIYPLSSQLFQKSVQANLLNSSWEFDLKRFYSAYSDTFFESCFEINKSEMPLLDKTNVLYPRDTDFEYGVKRVSYAKSGCQYAFFAPIYIDNVKDIPDYFNIKIKLINSANTSTLIKNIKVNIGNNGSSDYNYIYKYLSNYLSKIDNNVIYMDNDNKTIIYYGIDLIKGGFTKFEDSTVSTLFNTKLPIQLFDYTISKGFKRNQVCMRQCLPLCFYFNVDEILTDTEKTKFAYGTMTFSGEYYTANGNAIDIYDFSVDYDNFKQDILLLNSTNGVIEKNKGFIDNIMDVPFPSLSDKWIVNYQFANKLSKTFNRWKLKYSTDENPYITNMSWAFSKNQNNNYKYSTFPSNFTNQSAFAEIDSNNKYNLIFPLGSNIDFYNKLNPASVSKYKAIMDNYCVSWFDVVNTDDFEIFKDNVDWANVDNGYVFYNGILYNLNYIYDRIPKTEKHIDKFAVLVYPNVSNIQNETYFKNNIKYASNILTADNSGTANAAIYEDILSNIKRQDLYNITYKDLAFTNNTYKKMNLSFDGMLLPVSVNDIHDIDDNKKYYVVTNDIVYKYNDGEKDIIKTKNFFDINTIYRTDLLPNEIKNIYASDNRINAIINLFNVTDGKIIIDDNEIPLALITNILNYIFDNNGDPIPDLFDKDKVGIKITEILPVYKGNMFINAIKDNETLLINDNINVFNPKKIEKDKLNIEDGKLFSTYGLQLCKDTGRFISISWLQYIRDNIAVDAVLNKYVLSERETAINAFKLVFTELCNILIKKLNLVDFNSDNYIGHLYYPELYYNNMIVANNVAIIKQNHFDTSIEDTVYTDKMDDNILYMHPFNIEYLINVLANKTTTELSTYDIPLSKDIVVLDEQGNLVKLVNKYNILNFVISNNVIDDETPHELFFNNWEDIDNSKIENNNFHIEQHERNLYSIDEEVATENVINEFNNKYKAYYYAVNKIMPTNDKLFTLDKIKNSVDNVIRNLTVVLNSINNEINAEISAINQSKYKGLNIQFKKMRAIINDINTLNVFLQFNGSTFMQCTSKDFTNNIIPQEIYKQTKVFDNNYDVKFKLEKLDKTKTIKFDNETSLFYYVDENGVASNEMFNIVVETSFVKLNKALFDLLNINDDNKVFNDLYIFRPLTDIEYDDKFANTKITNVNNNEGLYNTSILYPCFTSVFVEERKETLLYKNWVVNNISNVVHKQIGVYNEQNKNTRTFFRYNVNNTSLVINVDITKDSNGNNILNLPESEVPITTVYIEEFANKKLDFNKDSIKNPYNDFNLCFTTDNNGVTYGYYLININLDNSRNMFNIKGILDNNALLSNSNVDYIPQLKFITYINGVNIYEIPSYISTVFKQLCPFLNVNLLEFLADNNTIMLPKIFNLHDAYSSVLNNSIGAKEHKLVFNKQDNNAISITLLQRYTNAIIPYIYKVKSKVTVNNLKYKNVQKMLLDTGKYASIGDIIYNSESSEINEPVKLNIYTSNNNINIKDYNNIVDTYLPVEYKYFNASKMVNLEPQIKIIVNEKLTYEMLLTYESEEKTLAAFKSYLFKYTGINTRYSDDEILFLYKKYNKLYDTNPVGVFADGKTKAYKLTYIFNLL